MAVTITKRASLAAVTTNATSYATTVGAYTPAANSLLVAYILIGGNTDPPNGVTGHGVTFTQIQVQQISTTHRLMVYAAFAGASPSAAVVTIGTYGGAQTGAAIYEFEITGHDGAGTIANAFQQKPVGSGTGTTGTITYAAQKDLNNAQLSGFVHLANEATTPDATSGAWSEEFDGNFATPATGVEVQSNPAANYDTTSTATWTTSSAWVAIGLEIRAAMNVAVGAITLAGKTALLALGLVLGVGSISITSPYIGVAFEGPTVGSLDLVGRAPTVSVSAGVPIAIPAGTMSFAGTAPKLMTAVGGIPAGSLSVAGQAPTLSFGELLAVGSIDLTGRAPSVVVGQSAQFGVGAISATGLTPSLAFGLSIPVGSVDVVGRAPILLADKVVATSVGAVDLTGRAPTVSIGDVRPLGAGAIALTGLAPTALINQVVAIAAGTLDLTGRALTVSTGERVAPAVGAIDLTGRAPTVFADLTRLTAIGAIDIVGNAPTLTVDAQLQLGVGSISVTGLAPARLLDQPLALAVGTLDATSLAPALAFGIAVPIGSLDLAGQPPAVFSGMLVTAGVGVADLTGQPPLLAFGLALPVGSVSVIGQVPSLTSAVSVELLAGAIDLAGLAPVVSRELAIPLPPGALDVTGQALSLNSTIGLAVGSVQFTGYALTPVVAGENETVIAVAAGSLDLSGRALTLSVTVPAPVQSTAAGGGAGIGRRPPQIRRPAAIRARGLLRLPRPQLEARGSVQAVPVWATAHLAIEGMGLDGVALYQPSPVSAVTSGTLARMETRIVASVQPYRKVKRARRAEE